MESILLDRLDQPRGLVGRIPDTAAVSIGNFVLGKFAHSVHETTDREGNPHTLVTFVEGDLRTTIDVRNPDRVMADTVKCGDHGLFNRYVEGYFEPIPEMTPIPEDTATGHADSDAFTVMARTMMRAVKTPTRVADKAVDVWAHRGGDAIAKRRHSKNLRKDAGSIEHHYDLMGKRLPSILGAEHQMYTSGVWSQGAETLNEADAAKLRLLTKMLNLDDETLANKKVIEVLDIGAGSGGATLAALRADDRVHVTAIVTSDEHYQALLEKFAGTEYENRVDVRKQDYRVHWRDPANKGKYDRIFSLEINEHTPWQEFNEEFVEGQIEMLTPEGEITVQAVMVSNERYDRVKRTKRRGWIQSEVFPGHSSHCEEVIVDKGFVAAGMILAERHDLTEDYPLTFREWRRNAGGIDMSPEEHRWWIAYLGLVEAGLRDGSICDAIYRFTRPKDLPEAA